MALPAEKLNTQYQPRCPEVTVIHRVTKDHLETFLAEAELKADGGKGVPDFVEEEFRRFLKCGHLAGGFARLKCEGCGFERLVPFSCKSRIVCPTCSGRRMAERAAHLVDEVIPHVPVRQYVLSLPFALRYKLAWDHDLTRGVLKIFIRALSGYYTQRAKRFGIFGGKTGAVSVVQRAGSALNLNIHYHVSFLDGVFTEAETGELKFHPARRPKDEEIAELLVKVRKRILRFLSRKGIELDDDYSTWDQLAEEYPSLAGVYSASVFNLIATGKRAGCRVMRIGHDPHAPLVLSHSPRHARLDGFDLHAGKAIKAGDRERLERLLRYLLRPPVAQDRLKLLDDGRVLLGLKNKWSDGTTHMLYEPVEFLEKLAAVIPRPHINTVIYHGLLAPNAKLRKQVVEYGRRRIDVDAAEEPETPKEKEPKPRHYKWAELMRRSFDVDVLECPKCSGRMKLIALIEDPEVIKKILSHLNLPTELPVPAPARSPPEQEELDF